MTKFSFSAIALASMVATGAFADVTHIADGVTVFTTGTSTSTAIQPNSITLSPGNGTAVTISSGTNNLIVNASQGIHNQVGQVRSPGFSTTGTTNTTIDNNGINTQGNLTVKGVIVLDEINGVKALVKAEEAARIEADRNKASVAALDQVRTDVGTVTAKVNNATTGLDSKASTVSVNAANAAQDAVIATKASTQSVTNLTNRVDTAEGDISNLKRETTGITYTGNNNVVSASGARTLIIKADGSYRVQFNTYTDPVTGAHGYVDFATKAEFLAAYNNPDSGFQTEFTPDQILDFAAPKTAIGQDLKVVGTVSDAKGDLRVAIGAAVKEQATIQAETDRVQDARISAVEGDVSTLKTTVADHGTRLTSVEGRMTKAEKRIDNIEKVGVAIAINTIVNDALPQEVKDAGISLSASTGGINVVKQLEGGAHLSVGANGVSLGASKDLNDNVRVHGGVGTEGASVGLYVHEKGNGVGISTSGPSVLINNHAIPLTPQGFVVSAITGAYKSVTGKTAKEIADLKARAEKAETANFALQNTVAMQAEALAQLQAQVAAIVAAQAK